MLDVIIESNMKIKNYFDVNFNLDDGTYKPYKNNETKYIQVDYDHPPSIIKQIPKSIATRLSSLSSLKKYFSKPHNITNKTLQVADRMKN